MHGHKQIRLEIIGLFGTVRQRNKHIFIARHAHFKPAFF